MELDSPRQAPFWGRRSGLGGPGHAWQGCGGASSGCSPRLGATSLPAPRRLTGTPGAAGPAHTPGWRECAAPRHQLPRAQLRATRCCGMAPWGAAAPPPPKDAAEVACDRVPAGNRSSKNWDSVPAEPGRCSVPRGSHLSALTRPSAWWPCGLCLPVPDSRFVGGYLGVGPHPDQPGAGRAEGGVFWGLLRKVQLV